MVFRKSGINSVKEVDGVWKSTPGRGKSVCKVSMEEKCRVTWGTEEDCREKAREGAGASGNGEPHEAHNEEMGRPWGP